MNHTVSLLQIGDIHLPDHISEPLVDLKDHGFPDKVVRLATPRPLQNVLRELAHVASTVDAILLCGDLTSRGDIDGYDRCVDQLVPLLGLSSHPMDSLHVVPGNHDINRTLVAETDLFSKFRPLELAWKRHSLPILSASHYRASTITSASGCKIRVCSLNSCIGCGETRYLPPEIRDRLRAALDAYLHDVGESAAFALLGEALDTPAFLESDITALCEDLDTLDHKTLPIVLAHHNLLPQAIVRVAMYTEVINAGLVRSRLSKDKHPLLYLHGHIHSDPVEAIFAMAKPVPPLVSISSPELVAGFNLITVSFSRNKVPLGCTVTPFRIEDDGGVEQKEELRVTLLGRGATPQDPRLLDVLKQLKTSAYENFPDILQKVRKHPLTAKLLPATLAALLLEAEWFGLLNIVDRAEDCRSWQIRRIA